MMHNLELNDIIISARLLEKAEPRVYLFDFEHDLVLKRQPLEALEKTTGKVMTVVPDALFDFRVPREGKKEARVFVCLEHDRGNNNNEKIRRKIRDYLTCLEQGTIEKRFGAQQFTVVFTTSDGERRVEKLRMLARLELGEGVPEGSTKNQMFKFVSVPPLMERSPIEPKRLFCEGALWLSPYGEKEKPGRLLEVGKGLP